jgi:alpha-ribazole phosphatase
MSSQEEQITNVGLLRHGTCRGGEIYRGRTDVQLNEEGWGQMEQAISASAGWQRIVTSPLLRCREFAEHYAARLGVPLQVDPTMKEMDFGDWEGRLLQDVWQADPELVSRFYEDPGSVTPPGGEPTAAAQFRIAEGWWALIQERTGEHILLVCHGGVIRLLLSHLLDLPLSSIARLHIPYASMARVQVHHRDSGDFPVLLSLNSGSIL